MIVGYLLLFGIMSLAGALCLVTIYGLEHILPIKKVKYGQVIDKRFHPRWRK